MRLPVQRDLKQELDEITAALREAAVLERMAEVQILSPPSPPHVHNATAVFDQAIIPAFISLVLLALVLLYIIMAYIWYVIHRSVGGNQPKVSSRWRNAPAPLATVCTDGEVSSP